MVGEFFNGIRWMLCTSGTPGLLGRAFGYERDAKVAGDHGELADDRLSGVAR